VIEEIKVEWLRRLRSGDYDQGTGFLHQVAGNVDRKDTYCCLGVLCEMAKEAGVVEKEKYTLSNTVYYRAVHDESDFSNTRLPGAVVHWAGLASNVPRVNSGLTVAELNDGSEEDDTLRSHTFEEIADEIEVSL